MLCAQHQLTHKVDSIVDNYLHRCANFVKLCQVLHSYSLLVKGPKIPFTIAKILGINRPYKPLPTLADPTISVPKRSNGIIWGQCLTTWRMAPDICRVLVPSMPQRPILILVSTPKKSPGVAYIPWVRQNVASKPMFPPNNNNNNIYVVTKVTVPRTTLFFLPWGTAGRSYLWLALGVYTRVHFQPFLRPQNGLRASGIKWEEMAVDLG
jgi:hypothetical protein